MVMDGFGVKGFGFNKKKNEEDNKTIFHNAEDRNKFKTYQEHNPFLKKKEVYRQYDYSYLEKKRKEKEILDTAREGMVRERKEKVRKYARIGAIGVAGFVGYNIVKKPKGKPKLSTGGKFRL